MHSRVASHRGRWALAMLHRWVGLTLGLLLAVSGMSGALLVLAGPVDRTLNAAMFEIEPGAGGTADAPAPLQPLLERLRAEYGPGANLTFKLPRTARDALLVRVRGAQESTVHIDPYRGTTLAVRDGREGSFNTLFELHSNLLAGEAGKPVLFAGAVGFVFMLATGTALWWPRIWRGALALRFARGRAIALFDLHRVGGIALGWALLVSVTSGAWMAYRPLADTLNRVAGSAAPALPQLSAAGRTALPLDVVVAAADRALPGGRVSIVQVPADASHPVRVRKRMPGEPHPNGLSSVYLDPYTAAVLHARAWHEADAGTRAFVWIYPLHIGELGGALHKTAVFLSGLALAGLGASGVWLWLSRRRPHSAA